MGKATGDVVRSAEGDLIANTQDPVALAGEPSITFGIVKLGFGQIVPRAVHFEDRPRGQVGEVDDVSSNGDLTADIQFQRSQCLP